MYRTVLAKLPSIRNSGHMQGQVLIEVPKHSLNEMIYLNGKNVINWVISVYLLQKMSFKTIKMYKLP